ncbi:uncharacterized protein LOC121377490 [Gigantopelta aegis]|uniref:uncharacterized protein LOC121377490 n=1 Tax=Gigantopelta aegis TaxID=1735272 RepID=UPI001B8882C3|nr:uncharacterized protein LOC121377490 [Gigantopelta aegis]XP_041361436.1 uncharacterized protein LOC121377490 [Gigantopelta aegis]
MKYTLLLILLMAIVINHQTEGWPRWRRIRIRWRWRKAADIANILAGNGKRDLSEFDTNKDGHVDESELEELFNKREVREILERADKDGNNKISMQEFQQFINELNKME